MSHPLSLARQNTRLLTAALILVELLVIGAMLQFLMLPLAKRSADDLAGLMLLSAQTWAELPPQTRSAFEFELLESHALALRADLPAVAPDEWHQPYFYLLEAALEDRTGYKQHLTREVIQSEVWYWTSLPAGEGWLAVGLPQKRIGTQPLAAFVIVLVGGLVLAAFFAFWLARRITKPLQKIEQAAGQVGRGEQPGLLPESGPRELATLSRRFNEMAVQVRDLITARTVLLAGISHDLRTPLARMMLALEMLKAAPSEALITRLEADVEQMNLLIGNVLDLARGLEHEACVLIDAGEFLGILADEQGSVDNRISVSSSPGSINLPPLATRRVVENLVQNAFKYAPGSLVELVCEITDGDWRIGVLDRGPGIPPAKIEAMFQPFQRLEPSRSPATGGSGLGLSIVRSLAHANGWRVELLPRDGGGLAAWFSPIK